MTDERITRLDSEYAARIRNIVEGDREIDHMAADSLLSSLLYEIGCKQTVAEYEKIGKWYA